MMKNVIWLYQSIRSAMSSSLASVVMLIPRLSFETQVLFFSTTTRQKWRRRENAHLNNMLEQSALFVQGTDAIKPMRKGCVKLSMIRRQCEQAKTQDYNYSMKLVCLYSHCMTLATPYITQSIYLPQTYLTFATIINLLQVQVTYMETR